MTFSNRKQDFPKVGEVMNSNVKRRLIRILKKTSWMFKFLIGLIKSEKVPF